MIAAEIHCELCAVYGEKVVSGGTVRHWCRMFKTNVQNEEQSGRPSVASYDLAQSFNQTICE
jgi:hypothetical protein